MWSWSEFYKSRVGSASYSQKFINRYEVLLKGIEKLDISVCEMGCGIGSVTLALMLRNKINKNLLTGGFDIDVQMVEYAKQNTGFDKFYVDDIFSHEVDKDKLYVSHGVLEHFNDKDIIQILDRYPVSMHYVPLEGWKIPSFGDERLLSFAYWEDLLSRYTIKTKIFNEGKDLVFYVRQ